MRIQLKQAAAILTAHQRIELLCHQNPDGDTLGSAYALCRGLMALKKQVRVCCSDPIPPLFVGLAQGCEAENFVPQLIVAVDVADEALLGALSSQYSGSVDLVLDHHPSNTGYGRMTYVRPDAAATAEVICDLLDLLGVSLDRDMAACLYTGLATDTGCFRYSNTTAHSFEMAARMLRAGAPVAEINYRVFEIKTKGRIALEQLLYSNLRYALEGRCAYVRITRKMMKENSATDSDLDCLAGLPRQIEGVEIGILFKERPEGQYKVSVRTNSLYDASAICQKLGGGGHKRAAGCTLTKDYEQSKAMILGVLEEYAKEKHSQ